MLINRVVVFIFSRLLLTLLKGKSRVRYQSFTQIYAISMRYMLHSLHCSYHFSVLVAHILSLFNNQLLESAYNVTYACIHIHTMRCVCTFRVTHRIMSIQRCYFVDGWRCPLNPLHLSHTVLFEHIFWICWTNEKTRAHSVSSSPLLLLLLIGKYWYQQDWELYSSFASKQIDLFAYTFCFLHVLPSLLVCPSVRPSVRHNLYTYFTLFWFDLSLLTECVCVYLQLYILRGVAGGVLLRFYAFAFVGFSYIDNSVVNC